MCKLEQSIRLHTCCTTTYRLAVVIIIYSHFCSVVSRLHVVCRGIFCKVTQHLMNLKAKTISLLLSCHHRKHVYDGLLQLEQIFLQTSSLGKADVYVSAILLTASIVCHHNTSATSYCGD